MPQSHKVVPTHPTLLCHEAIVIWKKISTVEKIQCAVTNRRDEIREAEIEALEVEIEALRANHARNLELKKASGGNDREIEKLKEKQADQLKAKNEKLTHKQNRQKKQKEKGVLIHVKSIYTYEIMYSPESTGLYSEIPRAICEAFHINMKLPWSLAVDNIVRWMWAHLFTRKTIKNHVQHMDQLSIGSVAVSYVHDLDVTERTLSEEDWDALILSNSCLRICMYFDRYGFLREKMLSHWHHVNEKFRKALEYRLRQAAERKKPEPWIEVLLWRMTMDYITPIYNLYLDENKLLMNSKNKMEIVDLMEKFHFSECADHYGDYFPTAPVSFINRIAINSVFRNEESYPDLLDRFLNYMYVVYFRGSILCHQREQLQQYAESIIGYLCKDPDFSHFCIWLGGTSKVGAFLKEHQDRHGRRGDGQDAAGTGTQGTQWEEFEEQLCKLRRAAEEEAR